MKSRRAQAHAKIPHYCTCGKVVFGNGAEWAHRQAHQRRQDGHRYTTQDEWRRRREAAPDDPALDGLPENEE